MSVVPVVVEVQVVTRKHYYPKPCLIRCLGYISLLALSLTPGHAQTRLGVGACLVFDHRGAAPRLDSCLW